MARYLQEQHVKGKRIAAVRFSMFPSTSGPVRCVEDIELEDGSIVRFMTEEGDGDYGTKGLYVPAAKRHAQPDPVAALRDLTDAYLGLWREATDEQMGEPNEKAYLAAVRTLKALIRSGQTP